MLEPVEDFLGAELPKTRVLTPRQDVVVESRAVLLPRWSRQLDLRILHIVLAPQLREVAEYDRTHIDGLLRPHRRIAARRRGIQCREEIVALRLCPPLRETALAFARANGMELPAGFDPAIREHLVLPVAKEPVGPFPILALLALRVLN